MGPHGFRNQLGPWPIHLPKVWSPMATKETLVIYTSSNRDGDTYSLSRESQALITARFERTFSESSSRIFIAREFPNKREMSTLQQGALTQLLTVLTESELSDFRIEFQDPVTELPIL
jgi:hypothetical protein